jgi:NADH-quinone oxidoreductase subunit G
MPNSNEVTLTIDDKEIAVPAGTMVVEAARRLGIHIPVFCYHDRLEPVGMCRMCLVKVGTPAIDRASGQAQLDKAGQPLIRWFPKPQTACNMPVSEGMVVITDDEEVASYRKAILEFLLTSHPLDCPVCDKGGECPLQDLTFLHGPGKSRFEYDYKFHFEKPIPLGDLIWLDRERCIQCARCIRFCQEIAGDSVLAFSDRGRAMEIISYSEPAFDSKFSGNTADVCPVGALTTADFRFKARPWELTNVPSLCNHCAVGCNTVLGVRAGEVKRVMPRQNRLVNDIWICDKGRFAHHFVGSAERLKVPLIREGDGFRQATWDEVLSLVVGRLTAIKEERGPQAIGGLAGAHLSNEDLYLFQKFFRAVIGSNNVDHYDGVRDGLTAAFGMGSGSDLGRLGAGDAILVLGADVEEMAPVLFLRLKRAADRGARLIVASGRPTRLERFAGQTLRYRYGTAAHLLLGILQVILAESLYSAKFLEQHGENLETLREKLAAYEPARLAELIGTSVEEISAAATAFAGAENGLVVVGPEASDVDGRSWPALEGALADLLLLTGHVGRADNGVLVVLPQANSRGALDLGLLPDRLPGYIALDEGEAGQRLAEIWGVVLPGKPGLGSGEMLSVGHGLAALYVAGADPAADDDGTRQALAGLDFLVVQELFLTETAKLADVVLPACSYAERDGTFTNMERRLQYFAPAVPCVGQSRPDWAIIAELARRMGADWLYASAGGVLAEMAKALPLYAGLNVEQLAAPPPLARRQSHYIYSGMSFETLSGEGWQWPVAAEKTAVDFSLVYAPSPPEPAPLDGDYPFLLVTPVVLYGRGTLISRSELLLRSRVADPYVALSRADAERLGVGAGEAVWLVSPQGRATLKVRLDETLPGGVAVAPRNLAGRLTTALTGRRAIMARVRIERVGDRSEDGLG